jgi:heptaprenyl diphosphate synthase
MTLLISRAGKTPGTDLREGVPTLVTLRVMASSDPKDRDLQKLLSGPIESEILVAEVLVALRSHPALEESRDQLLKVAGEARSALKPLPICDATAALFSLCDAVIDRSH